MCKLYFQILLEICFLQFVSLALISSELQFSAWLGSFKNSIQFVQVWDLLSTNDNLDIVYIVAYTYNIIQYHLYI